MTAVALTFDTDNDLFDDSLLSGGQRRMPAWRGVEEGIPRILDLLDALGIAPVTWFVRCDNQLASVYGDAAHLLQAHDDLWRRCEARGDELAWHPHLYREVNGAWVLETEPARLADLVPQCLEAFRATGREPTGCRIGEAYGSDELMAILERVGMTYDSSAMPGRKRDDDARLLDWSTTPDQPYRPVVGDHRVPGIPSRRLVEIPMSMVPVEAAYDLRPFRRYVDLSFQHERLAPGVRELVGTGRPIVTMTHPSAVVDDLVEAPHGLIGFGLDNFEANLRLLADGEGEGTMWRTMQSLAELVA